MLLLAPAGLRGGLKLEAYHQSRQPQSFFLCGPRCSGTSDRCSGRFGVISYALLRQPYLRPHHCGDLGFVSRYKPAEDRIPDVLAAPDVVASCITTCRGRRVSFSTDRRLGPGAGIPKRLRPNCHTTAGPTAKSTPLFRDAQKQWGGHTSCGSPLTTSLRGPWVSGLLPPGNGGTNEGAATLKPTT